MTDYRIDVACGREILTISPESPLRLLSGGLIGLDSADFDVEIGSYADDHGGYVRRRRFAEREIIIKFEITENPGIWRRRIASVINPREDCAITVSLDGVCRRIEAVPTGRIVFESKGRDDFITVTLRFLAPDPFLKAESEKRITFEKRIPLLTFPMNFYPSGKQTVGYRVRADGGTVKNEGDAPCGVVITIRARGGEVKNPYARYGDKFVRVIATLSDGDELTIDTRKRKKGVYVNGERRMIFDWKSVFFSLETGENELEVGADQGKEYMTVQCEYTPVYFGM